MIGGHDLNSDDAQLCSVRMEREAALSAMRERRINFEAAEREEARESRKTVPDDGESHSSLAVCIIAGP